MPTFLYTVARCEDCGDRLRLEPGIPLGEGPPGFGQLKPGDLLDLRFPDGTSRPTTLHTFSVCAQRGDDGQFFLSLPMMICLAVPRKDFR